MSTPTPTTPKGISDKDFKLLVDVMGESAARAVVDATAKAGDALQASGVQFKSVWLDEPPATPATPTDSTPSANVQMVMSKMAEEYANMIKANTEWMEQVTASKKDSDNQRQQLEAVVNQLAAKVDRFILTVAEALRLKTRASYADESALDLALLRSVDEAVTAEVQQRTQTEKRPPLITKMMDIGGLGDNPTVPTDPLGGNGTASAAVASPKGKLD